MTSQSSKTSQPMSCTSGIKKNYAPLKSKKPSTTAADHDNDLANTVARAIDEESSATQDAILGFSQGENIREQSSTSPLTNASANAVPQYAFVGSNATFDETTSGMMEMTDLDRMAQSAFDLASASVPPLPTLDASDLNFNDYSMSPLFSKHTQGSPPSTFSSDIPATGAFDQADRSTVTPQFPAAVADDPFMQTTSQMTPQILALTNIFRAVPNVQNAAQELLIGQQAYDNESRTEEGHFRSLLHHRAMIESGNKSNVARDSVSTLEHHYLAEVKNEVATDIPTFDTALFEAHDNRHAPFTVRLQVLLSAALAAQFLVVDADEVRLETRKWVLEKLTELRGEVFAWLEAHGGMKTKKQKHLELPAALVWGGGKPRARAKGKK